MVNTLNCFLFQPLLYNWCNKGCSNADHKDFQKVIPKCFVCVDLTTGVAKAVVCAILFVRWCI